MQSLLNWFTQVLSGAPKELVCFIVSMVPLIELRGGLIAASLFGIPYLKALLICLAGNILPIPFALWLITPIFTWLKKTKLFRGFVEKMESRYLGKSDKVQKYEFWGLVLFVGIPLPGTGAWSGSLIASLLNIRVKRAFPAIVLGVFLAAAIMSFITYAIPWIVTLF